MDGSTFDAALFGGANPDDAWLDTLLRADAAGQTHIEDAGFTDVLMARIPQSAPRPAPVRRWLVPGVTIAACAATALLTPAGAYFAENILRLGDVSHFSPSSLLVLVPIGLLYACSFASVRD